MAVRLSASRIGRATFTPRKIPRTHFCRRLSRPQGHSAAGRIRSMEKIHLSGTRTRDLPACSIVPQPTTLPRAPRCTVRILSESKIEFSSRFEWSETVDRQRFLVASQTPFLPFRVSRKAICKVVSLFKVAPWTDKLCCLYPDTITALHCTSLVTIMILHCSWGYAVA
jgi:hypothetical protein